MVGTREVLAMVNYPVLTTPMRPDRGSSDGLRNRALTDVLEPGSVIKPFAMAAVMEAGGRRTRYPEIDTSPGTMEVAGPYDSGCAQFSARMTATELITKSVQCRHG